MANTSTPKQNGKVKVASEERHKKGITALCVRGYKALAEKSEIEIGPLTLLAGSNSSGKSSILQPLLLMKQTLGALSDPGSLLLSGPNVKLSSAEQCFSKVSGFEQNQEFQIGIEIDGEHWIRNTFQRNSTRQGLELELMSFFSNEDNGEISLKPSMSHDEVLEALPRKLRMSFQKIVQRFSEEPPEIYLDANSSRPVSFELTTTRNRCFVHISIASAAEKYPVSFSIPYGSPSTPFEDNIQKLIHVPGLRGNPQRTYLTFPVFSDFFPEAFDHYVASTIREWQDNQDNRLQKLGFWLTSLGLTSAVKVKNVDTANVELAVNRLISKDKDSQSDMVNIADVGFGVSQILPVLVALLVAQPGQLVYIEQPEIHLHPRAQVTLAEILCDAAKRGVKVVAETHSESLLIAIQSLVAEGAMPSELVKLHWFTRREDGVTQISSADLDEVGAFGDWPEDFAEVSMALENRYLSAAEPRLWN